MKTSSTLVSVLKEILGAKNPHQLAQRLEVADPTISKWESGGAISKKHLRRIIEVLALRAITPLLEIHAVSPQRGKTKRGKTIMSWRIDSDAKDEKLRKILDGNAGVYLFYDSSGEVLYVGKASNLYVEIRQRLNRKIYFRNGGDSLTESKINKKSDSYLGKITCYISAYGVLMPQARSNVEAFLIRSFANNHTNSQMANFKFKIQKTAG